MRERIEWDDGAAHHIRTRSLRYPDAVDIEPAWTSEAVNDPERIVDEPDLQSAHASEQRSLGRLLVQRDNGDHCRRLA